MILDRKTPPPIKDFERLTIPPMSTLRLPNHVSINTIVTGSSPANRLSVVWNYGANRCGGSYAAALVPLMILQGTKKMSASRIVDEIDFLGAFLSHSTYSGHTALATLSLNEMTPKVLDILYEIIREPVFPEDRFIALLRKAISNLEVNLTRTSYRAFEELTRLLSGSRHPYNRPLSLDNLSNITLGQVKDAWQKGLTSTDIQIFASGEIPESLNLRIIDFAKCLRNEREQISAMIHIPYNPEKAGVRYITMPEAKQSSIALGIPTITRDHPDYIPLRITVMALGGYFGSRLMKNIREEKGLTYGISASLAGTFEGASINIQADCDTNYIDRVLVEIDNEITRLANELMSEDELGRLKSYYMTSLAGTLESFKSIGEYYENQITIGLQPNYFDLQQVVLSTITPEDIRKMAEKYILTDNAITVIAGPRTR